MLQQIDGKTRIFLIIGQPIGHTLSPAMYNAAFAALSYNGVYLACAVQEDGLAGALQGLRSLGICGGNVTIPYKEKIIPLLDGITDQAKLCGAVNTFYWEEDKLMGTNTDGAGFLRALQRIEPDLLSLPGAIILGAGGAAKAVAVSLALAGLPEIYLVNRDQKRAADLAAVLQDLGCKTQVLEWRDAGLARLITRLPLLINTTPLGMSPACQGLPPLDYELLTPRHLVADLIYKPAETLFLRQAKAKGARTMNGLSMLLEQGVLSFQIWSGLAAPTAIMSQELERWFK